MCLTVLSSNKSVALLYQENLLCCSLRSCCFPAGVTFPVVQSKKETPAFTLNHSVVPIPDRSSFLNIREDTLNTEKIKRILFGLCLSRPGEPFFRYAPEPCPCTSEQKKKGFENMVHNNNEFQGFFAEFFDRLHEGCGDEEIWPVLLKPYGNRILELGSGTGRILIPLAKAGFRVTGIEYEPDMIALMEQKDYPRDHLKVIQGDARSFSLGKRFDIIMLSCNFINHFADANDVVAILSSCRNHLDPDGCVIIDCSAPDTDYMVRTNGKEEILSFTTGSGSEIRDYFRPEYDFLSQIEKDVIRLEEWKDGVLLREARTEETLTWYYPREIRSLIREAGLSVFRESAVLASEGKDRPIGPGSESMVFWCRPEQPLP